jgi:hypothetical protein
VGFVLSVVNFQFLRIYQLLPPSKSVAAERQVGITKSELAKMRQKAADRYTIDPGMQAEHNNLNE